MRTFLIIIVFSFLSCEKERSSDNQILDSGWKAENLNTKYLIQFPANYTGSGFNKNTFYKSNPDSDLIISYCNSADLFCNGIIGDTLSSPPPEKIMILPYLWACSFISLDKREIFYNNDLIKGILYH